MIFTGPIFVGEHGLKMQHAGHMSGWLIDE
jgi:hypothetical protein